MTTPDDYPRALRSAEAAATAWKQAVEHQQDATPRHADFYAGMRMISRAVTRSIVPPSQGNGEAG